MNDVLAGKIVSSGHLGLAGLTAVQCAALCKQFSSCSTMNGSVHTAASEKSAVRCVYYSFHIIDFRDITSDGPNDRVSNFHTILLMLFNHAPVTIGSCTATCYKSPIYVLHSQYVTDISTSGAITIL